MIYQRALRQPFFFDTICTMQHAASICLCLSGLLHAWPSTATAVPLPPDLAKAVADYDTAQIQGDGAALRRLLAEDYALVNSSGAIESKAQLIADYTAPGYKLDPFVVRDSIQKVWADGAVVGGVATLSGTDGGKRFEVTLRFADIWAKRRGVWQVIYTHVSRPK
jgi:ketosteroid isomerase-like protein